LGFGAVKAFELAARLCDRVEASVAAYLEERAVPGLRASTSELAQLVRRLLAADPSIGLIRRKISELSEGGAQQIEVMALRRSDQVPVLRPLASGLRDWAKSAPALELLSVLRLCLVEGGAMVPVRHRPNTRQSAGHFEPVVFGRGRGVSLPKLQGGRPAGDAEVRLIAHLAVDWLESTGVRPETGRDGNSAFSGLVYSVFGWLDIEDKAQHCLRQYWAMTKVKRVKRW
jgi:hypothetical protein